MDVSTIMPSGPVGMIPPYDPRPAPFNVAEDLENLRQRFIDIHNDMVKFMPREDVQLLVETMRDAAGIANTENLPLSTAFHKAWAAMRQTIDASTSLGMVMQIVATLFQGEAPTPQDPGIWRSRYNVASLAAQSMKSAKVNQKSVAECETQALNTLIYDLQQRLNATDGAKGNLIDNEESVQHVDALLQYQSTQPGVLETSHQPVGPVRSMRPARPVRPMMRHSPSRSPYARTTPPLARRHPFGPGHL